MEYENWMTSFQSKIRFLPRSYNARYQFLIYLIINNIPACERYNLNNFKIDRACKLRAWLYPAQSNYHLKESKTIQDIQGCFSQKVRKHVGKQCIIDVQMASAVATAAIFPFVLQGIVSAHAST